MYPTDERLEKVDEVTIEFETFKKALKRNYLSEPDRWGRSYVLRLYPPFESEMEAEYYESEQGVHYDSNWNEKPFHIPPELIVLEGVNNGFNGLVNWPTEYSVRNHLTDEEIEEEGGIEESLSIGREIFWDELEASLPDTFNLGCVNGYSIHKAKLNWKFNDD